MSIVKTSKVPPRPQLNPRGGLKEPVMTPRNMGSHTVMPGSYKPPREFNWVIGVTLLVLTMLMSFTGYLLPWDQLAIWAITVGSNMAGATPFLGMGGPGSSLLSIGDVNFVTSVSDARFALLGGRFVGESALLRFYVLHCLGLPFIIMIFMIVHFWRIRKDGGISGPT